MTELDWWEKTVVDSTLTFTAAPARHFSGRGLKRNQTFWSSFILKTSHHNLYLGGDSGYDTHFKEIGTKYGPLTWRFWNVGNTINTGNTFTLCPKKWPRLL
ncbi:MAG: MBL fold metallo-hydrolase [Spirosomataceae bacterium]